MLVASWLLRAADRRPDHEALSGPGYALTYAQLRTAVDLLAGELAMAGARKGERVALLLPPGRGFVLALHAVLRLGAVAVPLDPQLPAEERARRSAGAVLTVGVADDAGGPGDGGLARANAEGLAIRPADAGKPAFADGAESGSGRRETPLLDTHDLDAPAVVVHTSGTSGAAKPIPLTYGNWLWSAIGSAATLGCPPDERWLCAMPLHHVGGLSVLLRSVIAGTTAVVHEGWDTERVLATLTGTDGAASAGRTPDAPARRPTMVSLVPTTFRRLLDAGLRGPDHDLRWVLLGGAAIPAGLLEDAAAADVPVAPTYGMTEATSQIATLGPPLFCTTVRIDDPRGGGGHGDPADALGEDGDGSKDHRPGVAHPTTDPDVVGEILVRGPTVASVAVGPDGWLRTGDLGRLDERGHLTVVGRTADTIISGGENVLPLEVERVLDRIDGVRESAVFGRPDPEWGERVCARLIVDDPAGFDVEALREAIRPWLAAHQRPREVEIVDALPRTPSGKLLRRELH
ncbi:MAG: AMP-binding protein [Patulibacter sp.]